MNIIVTGATGFVGRGAYIRGDHGAKLRGLTYRISYALLTLFSPILRRLGGGTSNAEIGQAMILTVRSGRGDATLSSREINELAAQFESRDS